MLRQLDALTIGNELLNKHNLHESWKIEFNKSPHYLGKCHSTGNVIEISVIMLNSCTEAEFRNIMLHEIAHALVGTSHQHDEVWKKMHMSIGGNGSVYGSMNLDGARSVQPSEQKRKKNLIEKKCPICGKVAIETSRATFGSKIFLKLECGHLVSKDQISGEIDFSKWTSLSGKKLFKYQIEGAEFIVKSNGRCLIADEPGLGKTAQAISFLTHFREIALPALWLCKTILKLQAVNENYDWGELKPQVINNSRFFPLPNMDIYVCSFDLLRRLKTEKLEALGVKTIVFDEVQHIKNPDSTRTQEVRKLVNNVDFFIALSGTPWKNRGSEYFSVLNMLAPEKFPSYKYFKDKWVDIVYDSKTGKYKEGGIRNIPRFREFTKDIVIRRMREDVQPDLPPINRQIRYVELEDIYGEAYEKAEGKVAEIIKDLILEGKDGSSIAAIGSELMKLKHITGLAKVDAQVEDAIEFLEDTEDWQKLTIFHHHIDVGDDLELKLNKWLIENGYNSALRLKGGEKPETRYDKEKVFKNDIKNRVLIASTLASGEGLNFQFCQNASMMERQFNAANEEQAELRFSRPLFYNDTPEYLQEHLFDDEHKPRKVSIRIPYMICAGTVDEILNTMVETKRINFNRSMNEGQEGLQFSESNMIRELAEAIVRKRYGKK